MIRSFLSSVLLIAQAMIPTPPSEPVFQAQAVRSLPGGLNEIPVFNSNSPEIIQSGGILLSTFPPQGMQVPEAHLNFPLQGRFDVFAHHVARPNTLINGRTLYLGILLHNPGKRPLTIDILAGASYLTQPDAPFIDLPASAENLLGTVYAGPGSRVTNDLLRGVRPETWPGQLVLAPGESQMLLNRPIPNPPNGCSNLIQVRSSNAVYVASLARYADLAEDGTEQPPTVTEWQTTLTTGALVTPRDLAPTPLEQKGTFVYGRVAGVARGSAWQAKLSDDPTGEDLTIPQPGAAISYVLSTANFGTLGTNQVQSAPMLVRYPDTAYRAHGNYGVAYNLNLLLKNPTDQPQTITLAIQSPQKPREDKDEGGLRFYEPPKKQVTYRGTVRLRYDDSQNLPQTRYVHLVQHLGQQGEPLIELTIASQERRLVLIDFLYAPDSTPPQVLTLRTLATP